MKKSFIIVSLLMLAACATEGEYRNYVYSHIGMSEDDLIIQLGVPDKRHTSADKKFFEYKESEYNKVLKMRLTCETTYILKNGFVEDVTFRGNNCTKYPKLF